MIGGRLRLKNARRAPLASSPSLSHTRTHTLTLSYHTHPHRQSVRNKKFREALVDVLSSAGVGPAGSSKVVGTLLYTVAGKVRERERGRGWVVCVGKGWRTVSTLDSSQP